MSEDPLRRFAILVGVAAPQSHPPLARVTSDVEKLHRLFERSGFTIAQPALQRDPTATQILDEISAFFADPARTANDVVLLYISGHGIAQGAFRTYSFIASDYDSARVSRTTVSGEALAAAVFDGAATRHMPGRLILVLDTCHSEWGLHDFVSKVESSRFIVDKLASLATFGPSGAFDFAQDGTLADDIEAVFGDRAYGANTSQRALSLLSFLSALGIRMRARNQEPVLKLTGRSFGEDEPTFLNPTWNRELEGRAPDDLYWITKLRGVGTAEERGTFYQPRLTLDHQLREATSKSSLVIVTGNPGSGKTTLVAQLAADRTAETAEAARAVGAQLRHFWRPDVVVLAASGSFASVHRSIATQLGCELAELDATIELRQSRILFDGLDESPEQTSLASFVRRIASSGANVVVATRRGPGFQITSDSENATIVDVDEDRWAQSDVQAYALNRLGWCVPALEPANRERLAERVAERAGSAFLIAQTLTRMMMLSDAPATVLEDFDTGRAMGDLIGADLQRFGADGRTRLVDVLRPLAFGLGRGLPRKGIWHRCASALARRVVSDSDVEWALEHAGYYVLQQTDAGEAVYRLYHHTLTEYLRADLDVAAMHGLMMDALLGAAGFPNARAEVTVAEPYVRHYLAEHAGMAGRIDEIVCDPSLLVWISRSSLVPRLNDTKSADAQAAAHAYAAAATDDGELVQRLRIEADRYGARNLGARLDAMAAASQPAWWPTASVLRTELPRTRLASAASEANVARGPSGSGVAVVWSRQELQCIDVENGAVLWHVRPQTPLLATEVAGTHLFTKDLRGRLQRRALMSGAELESKDTEPTGTGTTGTLSAIERGSRFTVLTCVGRDLVAFDGPPLREIGRARAWATILGCKISLISCRGKIIAFTSEHAAGGDHLKLWAVPSMELLAQDTLPDRDGRVDLTLATANAEGATFRVCTWRACRDVTTTGSTLAMRAPRELAVRDIADGAWLVEKVPTQGAPEEARVVLDLSRLERGLYHGVRAARIVKGSQREHVVGVIEESVYRWDATALTHRRSEGDAGPVFAGHVTRDGTRILVFHEDNRLVVYDADCREVERFAVHVLRRRWVTALVDRGMRIPHAVKLVARSSFELDRLAAIQWWPHQNAFVCVDGGIGGHSVISLVTIDDEVESLGSLLSHGDCPKPVLLANGRMLMSTGRAVLELLVDDGGGGRTLRLKERRAIDLFAAAAWGESIVADTATGVIQLDGSKEHLPNVGAVSIRLSRRAHRAFVMRDPTELAFTSEKRVWFVNSELVVTRVVDLPDDIMHVGRLERGGYVLVTSEGPIRVDVGAVGKSVTESKAVS